MSKYTTELRYICEEAAGVNNHEEMYNNPGYNDTSQIIETARTKLFDFDYPIFDVNYKATLETKIIKHYYFREIGAESYGMFKMWLDRRMNEIMPYYNQLYQSELLKFNPFYNSEKAIQRDTVDTHDVSSENVSDGVAFRENRDSSNTVVDSTNNFVGDNEAHSTTTNEFHSGTKTTANKTTNSTEVVDESTEGESHSTGNNKAKDNSDHWTAYSDTPQGGLTGIANNNYLTNVTHTWADSGSNIDTDTKNDETHKDDTDRTTTTNTTENSTINTTVNSHSTTHTDSTEHETGDTTFHSNTDSTSHGVDKTQTSTTNGGTEIYTGSGKYLEYVLGKEGTETYSEMLEKYRKTFLNIDMMVIDRLSDLFFNLW